jgi:hypothetical protein
MTDEQLKKKWADEVSAKLVGRKIVKVRYMSKKEVNDCGWYNAAVIIKLDDGTMIYPMSDDEGNNAGALATTNEDLSVIPVI